MSDAEQIERDFAALVKTTILDLEAAKSQAEDRAAWEKAIREYGRIKVLTGGDENENIVHFFAVDGIGYETQHPVVCNAVATDKARRDRWVQQLVEA